MAENIWWQQGVIYEIYPRSFQDTNGDGVGDIAGIQRRLGYLKWLGVDALWISPIYPSPMADFGYDISDYCGVDALFGSLDEFERLLSAAHAQGLKIILDFVPNHTSHHHPWFVESRSSRTNPKREWYIWRDGKFDAGPPNNWVSQFGGSAWTMDAATGQYYLHSFLREQPDLNWRNPEVRAAMYDVLRFWLDRGVDGFRVDVMWLLIKDAAFRDNPPNPGYERTQATINRFLPVYNADQPETQDLVAEMRAVLEGYGARVLIGEIYLPLERLVAYYGKDLRGAQLPFNFQLIYTAWSANEIKRAIVEYGAALPPGGWPNWVLGNHDQPRIAARVGSAQARVAAMLLLTLRGTPTMYYGDELGTGRVIIPAGAMRDPWEKNEPGLGLGRDPARTPFAWDDSPNAAFTSGVPWLPLPPECKSQNFETLRKDATSILNLYRRLLKLRRRHSALNIGSFHMLGVQSDMLAYERASKGERVIVCLNFGDRDQSLSLAGDLTGATVLLSTHLDRTMALSHSILRPNEGVALLMAS